GDGMNQLIVFRALQGVGGAGLFSLTFVLIADLFPSAERGRYQGLVGAVFGLASVLGPFLGGLLTDSGLDWLPGVAGWRLVFYVNLPVGAVALWLIMSRMPALRPASRPSPFDYSTASLLVGGLLPLVLALQLDKTSHGWGSPLTLTLLGCATGLLTWFVYRSRRSSNPVLDLHLFRNPVFRTANAAQFLLGGAFLAVILFEPLFMVRVSGASATRAGVSLVPLSVGIALSSVLSGKLLAAGRGTIRTWLLAGGGVLSVGVALLATMPPDIGFASVLGYMLLCGLGFGPGFPLYPLAVQTAVEPRQLGQATSASQFFRQLGGVVATAVLGSVLNSRLASAAPAPLAYAAAIGTVYRWALVLAGAGVLVTLFMPIVSFRHSTQTP
ncbi:MAG: MFS transporter, partial [Hymenobacter sp.]|nr:MFS transporter [Hymenobacter sp.]